MDVIEITHLVLVKNANRSQTLEHYEPSHGLRYIVAWTASAMQQSGQRDVGTNTTATIDDLFSDTTYYVDVRVRNNVDTSLSTSVVVTTCTGMPAAVTGITALSAPTAIQVRSEIFILFLSLRGKDHTASFFFTCSCAFRITPRPFSAFCLVYEL